MFHDQLLGFQAHRANNGPIPQGIAPFISFDSFRRESGASRPMAKSWNHRLSRESQNRNISTLKASANPSSAISLGTARPLPEYCPWKSMSLKAQNVRSDEEPIGFDKSTIAMSCNKGDEAYDLGIAMNYGFAAGSPQLLRFITEHVELVHHPPYQDWAVSLTCGTTSAIEIVLRMLCNPGDWILSESYTYSGAIEAAKPIGVKMLGVQMDDVGLLPEDLDSKLSSWDLALGPKPAVLYTIPTGQNPTGATQTPERRRAIYEVAERHDLIVIEDDPYYYLALESMTGSPERVSDRVLTPDQYLNKLPPSYASLDRSGRVIRLDSTSKILAPGLRCGWITACKQLIQKFLAYTEFSTVAPSGPSQVMLYKLLDEAWGHEGFLNWLIHLSAKYHGHRDILSKACARYLSADMCYWEVPSFGMFLWIRLDHTKHPQWYNRDMTKQSLKLKSDIESGIYINSKAYGVQVSKGSWFAVNGDASSALTFRLTFAATPEEMLEQAVSQFAKAVVDEFRVGRPDSPIEA